MTRRHYIKPPRSEDCVWRSGPPPGIGWWPSSYVHHLDPTALRWWDGGTWSCVVFHFQTAEQAGINAVWPSPFGNRGIRWTDRWWETSK